MADQDIKVVVFDHGGVLTRGGESGTNEKAASRAMGLDQVIVVKDINDALKRGEISNQEYVDEINRRFPDAPRRLTMAVWADIYGQLVRDEAAYAFAARVKAAGFWTGMLSSVNEEIANRLWNDGSYDGFFPRVLSCHEGTAKPEPRIYAIVEQLLQPDFAPEQILFLDDQQQHLDAAAARGWRTIRVDGTEQMIADASAVLGLNGRAA